MRLSDKQMLIIMQMLEQYTNGVKDESDIFVDAEYITELFTTKSNQTIEWDYDDARGEISEHLKDELFDSYGIDEEEDEDDE